MPFQELALRAAFRIGWKPDAGAAETEIFFAVVEVVFQLSASAEFVVRSYRYVALIE